jgi:hypothetical protein
LHSKYPKIDNRITQNKLKLKILTRRNNPQITVAAICPVQKNAPSIGSDLNYLSKL